MRITNRMMTENAIQNMADNLEKMSKLQGKIATQKQFQNPSDDPARASASLSLRSNLRTLESYSDTAATTKNWMTASDNALNQLENLSVRASNLILRGLNDTLDPSERAETLGVEMQTLVNEAIDVLDDHLFERLDLRVPDIGRRTPGQQDAGGE